jgi:hypothetical protein
VAVTTRRPRGHRRAEGELKQGGQALEAEGAAAARGRRRARRCCATLGITGSLEGEAIELSYCRFEEGRSSSHGQWGGYSCRFADCALRPARDARSRATSGILGFVPRKSWLLLLAIFSSTGARADVVPPPRASVLIELTVDNQAALPLRFVVTNCYEPPALAVLDPAAPVLCHPTNGPVRVFGFKPTDLTELRELVKRDAGGAEASSFLAAKAKTCGQLRDEDVIFPASSGVGFVAARYALEPRPKGGCKLTRVSATTKPNRDGPPAAGASAALSAPSAAPPAPSSPPAGSGCGCKAAGSGATGSLVALIPALLYLVRRRTQRRPRCLAGSDSRGSRVFEPFGRPMIGGDFE